MENKNPDIALFMQTLDVGGVERMMLHLAQGFVQKNLTVDLVLLRASGRLLQQVPANVRIVNLNCARTYLSLGKLWQYLRRERPKALISALEGPNLVAIVAKWLSGRKIRHAISINCFVSLVYTPANSDIYTRRVRARLSYAALKILYRFADHCVAISSGVADDISRVAKIPRQRVHVFNLPVITPTLQKKMKEAVHHDWFHPGAPPVIIAVGRLTDAKDYPTLLKAFSTLHKRRSARLIIVGEGELRSELQRQILELGLEGAVALLGYVENQYAYMARASVFVLSSSWEGLSAVLIEALYCGTKVVSTDCHSGPREILEDGKWGRLVRVGDSEALAVAIEESLDLAASLPPAEALDRFSLETVVNHYRKLLLL